MKVQTNERAICLERLFVSFIISDARLIDIKATTFLLFYVKLHPSLLCRSITKFLFTVSRFQLDFIDEANVDADDLKAQSGLAGIILSRKINPLKRSTTN